MKEPMRTMLPMRVVAVCLGAPLSDELGEDLVEGRLVLFEPGDPRSLASALDAAFSASDEELKRRGDLAAAQAAGLRWKESARRLAALLRGRYT